MQGFWVLILTLAWVCGASAQTTMVLGSRGVPPDPVRSLSMIATVMPDGLKIVAFVSDGNSPVVSTEIQGNGVTIANCPQAECIMVWPIEQMIPGINELVFISNTENGESHGVYAKMSRP